MQDFILTKMDNGNSFEVNEMDRIIVCLEENPTTGYNWAVDMEGNEPLKVQDSKYEPLTDIKPGSGGLRKIEFVATRAGHTQIKLKQWKEWEGDASIIDRYNVTINISKK